jgi:hypothetical protein
LGEPREIGGLADKCNEGELMPEEAAEYTGYVDADLITVLRAQARGVQKRKLGTNFR